MFPGKMMPMRQGFKSHLHLQNMGGPESTRNSMFKKQSEMRRMDARLGFRIESVRRDFPFLRRCDAPGLGGILRVSPTVFRPVRLGGLTGDAHFRAFVD